MAEVIDRRMHVHRMWAAVAPRWEGHADFVDARTAAMTARLLDAADLAAGQDVLELASGPGGAGLAAAAMVGAEGTVVVSDVVAEMAAIAGARAAERGLRNVTTATLDLEAIDRPDESFDVVLCREGLMFAVEPERALAEIHRVLRPGGRFSLSVWGPRDANPWLGIVLDAVTATTGVVVPPPEMPGPFALADRARLASLLADAGFADVRTDLVDVPLHAESFSTWWARTCAVAGPVAMIIGGLDEAGRAELERHARAATERWASGDGLDLPGLAIIGCGRRP